MLSSPLVAYAETYNFAFTDEAAYGFVKNYLVSVCNDGYKKSAFVNFFTPETEEGDSVLKLRLSDEIKALELDALSDYEVLINGVALRTSADLVDFDFAVNALCDLVADLGFLPANVCSECGYDVLDDGNAYISLVDNRACFLCDECTAEAKVKAEESNEDLNKGSKKLGVFAAVLGGFISFAVMLALYMFVFPAKGLEFGSDDTDRISSLLLAIPFSAFSTFITFLFYRLFTHRKGVERILPCFAVSAFFTIAGVYSSTCILYSNTFELSFNKAMRMFGTIIGAPVTDPYYRTDFISYGLYCLAVVIAVTLIYSLIFDTKKAAPPQFIPYCDAFSDYDVDAEEEVLAEELEETQELNEENEESEESVDN